MNLLRDETSPYLRQHQDNPVHWRPWGREALAEAAATGRPILLSVGYAACHWCHVMAHESFEDEATAALMNALFVNIKVDREERPDIDTIYQSALALMGQQGGWPLTMFLTPDGEPFWGGTYFPPEARYGRAGFPDVLRRVSDVFKTQQEAVNQNVVALRGALQKLSEPPAVEGEVPADGLERIAAQLVEHVDGVNGGFGGAPKFPQASIFRQFWRAFRRTGDKRLADAVTTTLDRICQGGIYDHLGGGFARYAVDERWLVPHFEKMLYDNAQLVELLALVWQHTKSPLYKLRVEETVAWLGREMTSEGGAFYSSLDADSEGEEGKFYVWTDGEIDALLGAEATLFKATYDVGRGGNWEGHTILNRLHSMQLGEPEIEARLAKARAKLLAARAKRIRPGLDDKILADWNGMMIAGLAFAGSVFARLDWVDAAARAFAFVRDRMTEDGRLRHSWRDGKLRHPATLDDYAHMARAGLALHEATGDAAYLAQAESWAAIADRHYWDGTAGGYFLSADDTDDVIRRTKQVQDQAVPAGNGTMAEVRARLFFLTGKAAHRERAEAITGAFKGELARNVFGLGTLLGARTLLDSALQVAIVGTSSEARAPLRRAVDDLSLPERIIQEVTPDHRFPADHPLSGKSAVNGAATAYVCRGPVCSLPITDADALRQALGQDRPESLKPGA
jgi:uncharacterized protein